jgi:hypothetical protein
MGQGQVLGVRGLIFIIVLDSVEIMAFFILYYSIPYAIMKRNIGR